MAFGPLYTGAILYAASRLKQGLNPTYSESMTYAAGRSLQLLGTRIGTGLIIFLGLIAFIIPGIVLMLHFVLIDAIVVLEGVQGQDARNLSVELTQGKRWNILGTVILNFIGLIIAIAVVSLMECGSVKAMILSRKGTRGTRMTWSTWGKTRFCVSLLPCLPSLPCLPCLKS